VLSEEAGNSSINIVTTLRAGLPGFDSGQDNLMRRLRIHGAIPPLLIRHGLAVS